MLNAPSPSTSSSQPTADPYKIIPTNPAYEGKQRYPCAHCNLDTPSRHYCQQCQQLCQFKDCLSKNYLPGLTLVWFHHLI